MSLFICPFKKKGSGSGGSSIPILTKDIKHIIERHNGSDYDRFDLTMPKGCVRVGRSLFANIQKLRSIVIPDGYTNISISAFYLDTTATEGLETVTLPESMNAINKDAFRNQKFLLNITLPAGVQLSADSFKGCVGLKWIKIMKTDGLLPHGSSAGETNALKDSTGYIFVSDELFDLYMTSPMWGQQGLSTDPVFYGIPSIAERLRPMSMFDAMQANGEFDSINHDIDIEVEKEPTIDPPVPGPEGSPEFHVNLEYGGAYDYGWDDARYGTLHMEYTENEMGVVAYKECYGQRQTVTDIDPVYSFSIRTEHDASVTVSHIQMNLYREGLDGSWKEDLGSVRFDGDAELWFSNFNDLMNWCNAGQYEDGYIYQLDVYCYAMSAESDGTISISLQGGNELIDSVMYVKDKTQPEYENVAIAGNADFVESVTLPENFEIGWWTGEGNYQTTLDSMMCGLFDMTGNMFATIELDADQISYGTNTVLLNNAIAAERGINISDIRQVITWITPHMEYFDFTFPLEGMSASLTQLGAIDGPVINIPIDSDNKDVLSNKNWDEQDPNVVEVINIDSGDMYNCYRIWLNNNETLAAQLGCTAPHLMVEVDRLDPGTYSLHIGLDQIRYGVYTNNDFNLDPAITILPD